MNDRKAFFESKGIDIEKCLDVFGDIESYEEGLREFLGSLGDKYSTLLGYLDSRDLDNYAILVHGIKSEAKYLGLDGLASVCLEHELKSKEHDYEYLMLNSGNLKNCIAKVLELFRSYE